MAPHSSTLFFKKKKLYNILLVLPNIEMNPQQVYMCSPSWTLLPPEPSSLLQYSCLENPMDGGAWQAAAHAVTKSRTQLSDLLSLFTFIHWRRKWQPTPVFLPGEPQGRRSLVGCRLRGRTESEQQQTRKKLTAKSTPLTSMSLLKDSTWIAKSEQSQMNCRTEIWPKTPVQ